MSLALAYQECEQEVSLYKGGINRVSSGWRWSNSRLEIHDLDINGRQREHAFFQLKKKTDKSMQRSFGARSKRQESIRTCQQKTQEEGEGVETSRACDAEPLEQLFDWFG